MPKHRRIDLFFYKLFPNPIPVIKKVKQQDQRKRKTACILWKQNMNTFFMYFTQNVPVLPFFIIPCLNIKCIEVFLTCLI